MEDTNNIQDAEVLNIENSLPQQKILSLTEMVELSIENARQSVKQVMIDNGGEKRLKELMKQLKGIEIKDINDTENLAKVKAINKEASKYRIAIEKERKAKKELPNLVGKGIEKVIAEYQAYVTPVESLSDEKLDAYEKMKTEADEKARLEAEQKLKDRITLLISNGVIFTGAWYTIADISVGTQMVQEFSDEDFEDLLSKVKVQNKIIVDAKLQKEKEEQDEKERQEALRKENEAKEKKLQEQQDAINKQLKDLEDAKNELSRQQKEKRNAELKPYIVYIRDYNKMLSLEEVEYQKEFSDIKEAKKQQEEFEEKERKEKTEREEKERLEAEARLKAENELVAQRAKRYEEIGYKYNYTKTRWELQLIGGMRFIDRTDLINEKGDDYFEESKLAIEKNNEAIRQKAELEEIERKALLSEQENYSEYVSQLKAIPTPTLTDATLLSKLNDILNLLNQE